VFQLLFVSLADTHHLIVQPIVEFIPTVKLLQAEVPDKLMLVMFCKVPVQLSNERIAKDIPELSCQYKECFITVPAKVEFVEFKE
jgi:hypothetical protein